MAKDRDQDESSGRTPKEVESDSGGEPSPVVGRDPITGNRVARVTGSGQRHAAVTPTSPRFSRKERRAETTATNADRQAAAVDDGTESPDAPGAAPVRDPLTGNRAAKATWARVRPTTQPVPIERRRRPRRPLSDAVRATKTGHSNQESMTDPTVEQGAEKAAGPNTSPEVVRDPSTGNRAAVSTVKAHPPAEAPAAGNPQPKYVAGIPLVFGVEQRRFTGTWAAIVLTGLMGGAAVTYLSNRPASNGTPAPVANGSTATDPVPDSVGAGLVETEPSAPILTESEYNEDGQVVRIRARQPVRVLEAFCLLGETHEDPREVVEVRPVDGGRRGVVLGVFRRPAEPNREYAVWIRLNRGTGEWFAGNGLSPPMGDPI